MFMFYNVLGKDIKDNPFGTFDEIQDEGM